MNDTNNTSPFFTNPYNETLIAIVSVSSQLLTILIFPFYSNVYRKNLAREKSTALFQVTRHFYRILKVYFLLCCVPILGYILGTFLLVVDAFLIGYICRHSECLLGILAIQRFFLYFFASTEKYLGLSENGFSSLIRFIYLTPPIAAVLSILFLIKYGFLEHMENLMTVYTGIVTFLCFFSLFAALLYIPLLISIRKLSHLSSAKLNKPQRYILWQLVVMTTVKCFSIHGTVIDGFCFPLVIQLTYLGCNKRNLDTLLGSFNNNWIKTICSLLCRSTLRVAPQQNIYSINVVNS
uniref:Serpentine Receptor, class Z n=1 Tax=Caenorhabditis tropicalis TaxID=1561998 RepID=A0A1I7TH41_9PELO